MPTAFPQIVTGHIGVAHTGKNYILDKGMPLLMFEAYIKSFAPYIGMIKLGWTTWALFNQQELDAKIALAKHYHIPLCLGGTLFEICATEGYYQQLLDYIVEKELTNIELASGFAVEYHELPILIKQATDRGLRVLVEIGYKNQEMDDSLSVPERIGHIDSAFRAGADAVILEAREAGEGYSVFKTNQAKNADLVTQLLKSYDLDKLIFEAPTRNSQIQMVQLLGPNVHMANIPFDEIPRIETIRRGLHADTFLASKYR